jgi:flagellin-specific chaperone FliS
MIMTEEELQNFPQMMSAKMAAQQQLINLLYSQVVDLTMMSKIELGDDVIEEIKRLNSIINKTSNI